MDISILLSIHHLVDTSVSSPFWLSWTMLVRTFVHTSLFENPFSILLAIYLGVKLLGQVVILFSTIWGIVKLFYTVVAILHFYQQYMKIPIFPHPCQHLLFSFLNRNYGYPNRNEVVTHYGFDLHCPIHTWWWPFFTCLLLDICVSSVEKCLLNAFAHFYTGCLFIFNRKNFLARTAAH